MKRLFGCHVSCAGGLENAIKNGEILGVNSIQIHPTPPRQWNSKSYGKGKEEKFLIAKETSNIKKVFFHAIYLINLATPDKKKFHLGKQSLVNYLDLCSRIKGDGVVVHIGSLKDQDNYNEGIKRVVEGVRWVLDNSPEDADLILEVAAGSGQVIGSKAEQLAEIADKVNSPRIFFALDSQHMWASGYDLKNNLQNTVNQILRILKVKKIKVIHLNDSKTELGSKKDRHENFGKGLIGRKALINFVNYTKLKKIPFILETPALKDIDSAKKEVKTVKNILEE